MFSIFCFNVNQIKPVSDKIVSDLLLESERLKLDIQ